MTTFALSTAIAGLKFEAKQTEQGGALFVKNPVVAYLLQTSSCTEITDLDYPSHHTYGVSTLTHNPATSTATFVTISTNALETGMRVVVYGASQGAYNVTTLITVNHISSFSYTVTSSPVSPATVTSAIFARGGKTTVPGVVYLNSRIYVQDIDGPIRNSEDGDPTAWDTLAFITPERESSNPVRIAKVLNSIGSFKEWDTEFFEDVGIAAPASPLARIDSVYLKLGCADPYSFVEFDGGNIWMSKRDQNQRSREIHVLNGYTPKKVSSPEIERLLNASNLTTTHALYLATAGHQLYSLTLKDLASTVVYDFNNGFWYQWTFCTLGQSTQVSTGALTSDGDTATLVYAGHPFNDGDPILVSSVSQAVYNGIHNASRIDANTVTFPLSSFTTTAATSSATVMSVAPYTESYFPAVGYAAYQNLDLVLHETNGIVYSLEPDVFLDNGAPINVHMRVAPWDGGNNQRKMISRFRVIGDRTASDLLVRYSDNDSSSYSAYRRLGQEAESAQLSRLGSTRRRVYELRHTEDTAGRWQEIEQDATQGS